MTSNLRTISVYGGSHFPHHGLLALSERIPVFLEPLVDVLRAMGAVRRAPPQGEGAGESWEGRQPCSALGHEKVLQDGHVRLLLLRTSSGIVVPLSEQVRGGAAPQ